MTPVRILVAAGTAALVLTACGSDPAPAPSPSPTPVAAPSPTASPSPGPSAPLTGEEVTTQDVTRPALAVKIENTAKARPQAGLETADIVIEEIVEGGVTRFFAVFQSEVPEQVGPIRSARLVDASLLPAFGGIFLYSGGRDDVEAAIAGTALRLTEGDDGVYRQSGRRAPSNLFADGPAVYETAAGRSDDLAPPAPWFTFDLEVPDGGLPGEAIDVSMTSQATSNWTWDAGQEGYLRAQGGEPQTTVSEEPVVAANVVVLAVETFERGCCDTNGSPYVVTDTTGEGRAIVLRDGLWFEAVWTRADAAAPFELQVGGRQLALRPGATWIHLAPSARLPDAPVHE